MFCTDSSVAPCRTGDGLGVGLADGVDVGVGVTEFGDAWAVTTSVVSPVGCDASLTSPMQPARPNKTGRMHNLDFNAHPQMRLVSYYHLPPRLPSTLGQ